MPFTILTAIQISSALYKLWNSYQNVNKISEYNNGIDSIRTQVEINNSAITSYLDLIHGEIDTLSHAFYKAAIQNLKFALNANDKQSYILEARNKFVEALGIEQNEHLIISHLGLALCQKLLNDEDNSAITLKNILNIGYTKTIHMDNLEKRIYAGVLGFSLFAHRIRNIDESTIAPDNVPFDEKRRAVRGIFSSLEFRFFNAYEPFHWEEELERYDPDQLIAFYEHYYFVIYTIGLNCKLRSLTDSAVEEEMLKAYNIVCQTYFVTFKNEVVKTFDI